MKKILVPGTYSTLEEACENASEGDVITIKEGKHIVKDTIEISSSITLCGETGNPGDVIIECPSSQTFKITGGSPSFLNLSVISGPEFYDEEYWDNNDDDEEEDDDDDFEDDDFEDDDEDDDDEDNDDFEDDHEDEDDDEDEDDEDGVEDDVAGEGGAVLAYFRLAGFESGRGVN